MSSPLGSLSEQAQQQEHSSVYACASADSAMFSIDTGNGFWPAQRSDKSAVSRMMAIVNATPDSFSDGGVHLDQVAALAFAQQAIAAGAQYLDVGGESTRPGALSVSVETEIARIQPIISALSAAIQSGEYITRHDIQQKTPMISIDTSKAVVAAAALAAGASIVNDICAGADPEMFAVVAQHQAGMVIMHMQGTPRTMQRAPVYAGGVFDEVCVFFEQRIQAALAAGVAESALCLDPGIGFGKTPAQNLTLLAQLPQLKRCFGLPLLVGLSRKSFLPLVMEQEIAVQQRDYVSHCFHAQLLEHCDVLRVHDVAGLRALIHARALIRAYAAESEFIADV